MRLLAGLFLVAITLLQSTTPITPENVAELESMGTFGNGVIFDVGFINDGEQFVVVDYGGVSVYDTNDLSRPVQYIDYPTDPFSTVVFWAELGQTHITNDGVAFTQSVSATNEDGALTTTNTHVSVDFATGEASVEVSEDFFERPPRVIAMSRDGALQVIEAPSDTREAVFEIRTTATDEVVAEIRMEAIGVTAPRAAFSPDGDVVYLFTNSSSTVSQPQLGAYDVPSGALLTSRTIPEASFASTSLFVFDERVLFTIDGTTQAYDPVSLDAINEPSDPLYAGSPNGAFVLFGETDLPGLADGRASIRVVDTTSQTVMSTLDRPFCSVGTNDFVRPNFVVSDEVILQYYTFGSSIYAYDVATGEQRGATLPYGFFINGMSMVNDTQVAVAQTNFYAEDDCRADRPANGIYFYELGNRHPVDVIAIDENFGSFAVRDGLTVIGSNSSLKLYQNGELQADSADSSSAFGVVSLTLSPSGELLAGATYDPTNPEDNSLNIWRVDDLLAGDFTPIGVFPTVFARFPPSNAAVLSDEWLVTVQVQEDENPVLQLYSIATGDVLDSIDVSDLLGLESATDVNLESMAYSAVTDTMALQWQISTGEIIAPLLFMQVEDNALRVLDRLEPDVLSSQTLFDPTGALIVTAGSPVFRGSPTASGVSIFDTATGELLYRNVDVGLPVAFSPDGRYFFATNTQQEVLMFGVPR